MPKQVNRNLLDISPPERLWLARVFRQGVSQDSAAPRAGVSHRKYVDFELGRLAMPPAVRALFDYRIPPLRQRLRLARRRSRRHLRPLAKALGVSHVTLLLMEKRADARLVAFWKSQGFRF